MLKTSIIIIVTYIIMQFSGVIGGFFVLPFLDTQRLTEEQLFMQITGIWGVISFALGLAVILYILYRNKNTLEMRGSALPVSQSIGWAIAGPFIAIFAQAIAGAIESFIGIEVGSDNTTDLIGIAKAVPLFILVISILAPVIEEIVFRKVLFGGLYRKYNFFVSAALSALIFAVVHGEPEHILVYASMGFTFAFLYVKTKRLIVPIFAHVAMNTYVVVVQFLFEDQIKMIQDQAAFIFPFL